MGTKVEKEFQRIQSDLESTLDLIREGVRARCEDAIKTQLADWNKRYPRHTFTAWDRMGIIAFEVSPPVAGQKFVDDLAYIHTRSTKLSALAAEALRLTDAWNHIEGQVSAGFQSIGTISAKE